MLSILRWARIQRIWLFQPNKCTLLLYSVFFFFLVTWHLGHVAQSVAELQSKYLLSRWHLATKSKVLFWKLFDSAEIIMYFFFFQAQS